MASSIDKRQDKEADSLDVANVSGVSMGSSPGGSHSTTAGEDLARRESKRAVHGQRAEKPLLPPEYRRTPSPPSIEYLCHMESAEIAFRRVVERMGEWEEKINCISNRLQQVCCHIQGTTETETEKENIRDQGAGGNI
ncbi:uncharacterized protein LOC144599175 [Rhinoraja longicauda]